MSSTFSVLFYTKNQSVENGRVPVMGRITINKTITCFSCKKEVSLTLWNAKANRAKGKSKEDLQKLIHIALRYKRQRAMCDMLLFMCFTGLAFADLKAIRSSCIFVK